MHWSHSEPTLSELLSDPIVKALMTADRVTPAELEADLSNIAAKLGHREPPRRRFAAIPAGQFAGAAPCV